MSDARRRKRGEAREDGKVFLQYYSKGGEWWGTLAQLEEQNEKTRIRYRQDAPGRAKRVERNRQWRNDNRDKLRACLRAYYRANKADFNRNAGKRRAQQLAAMPLDYCHDSVAVIYQWSDRVSKCTGIRFVVDHVMPLARGGEHHHRNLQILPATWNSRKHDNPAFELPDCYRMPAMTADNVRS